MSPEIKKNPAVVDYDTNLITGKPELRVAIDRDRASDLGVNVSDVATPCACWSRHQGVVLSEHGEEYDIRLRAERPTHEWAALRS